MLTEQEIWNIIDGFNWKEDPDYKRVKREYKSLPPEQRKQVGSFVAQKMEELNARFENDWLGEPGIPASDDGWNDICAEVIGRGQQFYDNITVAKLTEMAEKLDYTENFTYCIH